MASVFPFHLFCLLLSALLISTVQSSHSDSLRLLISDLEIHSSQRNLLQGVNDHHPCRTPGVSCDVSLRATRIVLPFRRLNGSISPSIGFLSELRKLVLADNRLSGPLPTEIAGCTALEVLDVSGPLPTEIAGCTALEVLDVSGNRLSGPVPPSISSLPSLRSLDLSSNRFTGDVRFLVHLPNLETLSLADNYFSGSVPRSLSSILRNLRSFDLSGNPDLTGDVPKNSLRRSLLPAEKNSSGIDHGRFPNSAAPSMAPSPMPSHESHGHKDKNRVRNWLAGFIAGSIAGIVCGLFITFIFRLLVNCIKRRHRSSQGPSIYSAIIKRAEDLAFLAKDDVLASLETIGRGGCGEVYKAELPNNPGKMIAIKKVMKRSLDGPEPTEDESRLLDKWMRQIRSEIQTVGKIRHRNLLPLLAHFARPNCHFLIYQYMKNGSLQDVLKNARDGTVELDWIARHKIAMGVAAGLEYLHLNHTPHIIHRDLKPANILLDDDMEARIADFGLAKEVPDANTHMSTSNVAGTVGYIAPEYHQTSKFTTKCDIYSFGVILGGLVMGKFPTDEFFQGTDEMSLVRWLRNVFASANPSIAIDPMLAGNGYEEQMLLVLRIACFCTADDPKERPNSKDVRLMLSQIKH